MEDGPDGLRKKSAVTRYILMLAIFTVGAAVGLGASWALRPAGQAVQSTVENSAGASLSERVAAPPETNRSSTVRGISSSELPYDGKPPPTEEGEPDADLVTSTERHGALPEERVSGMLRSRVEPSSGESVEDVGDVQKSLSDTPSTGPAVKAAEAGAAGDKSDKKQIAPGLVGAAKQSAKETQRSLAKAKAGEERRTKEASTKAASRKPAPARLAKDREIDRIKQEADKELQRKLEVGRANEAARAQRQLAASRYADQPVDSKTAHVRKVLAKCERIPNLFRREKCKWDLCGNRWGKHGCPSYSRPATTY
ncbi:hypothetical protein GCM10027343_30630 [Noviherbaspirillum agri]